MDESKPDQSSDKGLKVRTGKNPKPNKEKYGFRDDIDVESPIDDVKGPNVFERVKEEFEALKTKKGDNKEKYGYRDDIDVNTPIGDVKGPNVFERVREEFEALKSKKGDNKEKYGFHDDIDANTQFDDVKGPNVFERVKEEFEAFKPKKGDGTSTESKKEKKSSLTENEGSPSKIVHHKETHGRADDIDPDIPINEFKGPSILHRAKEEIEALVDTIHSKKDSDSDKDSPSPKKKGGFRASVKENMLKMRKP